MSIDVSAYQHIVVLTGAGISVASGLRAYRGPGGVWTEGGDENVATVEGFANDPAASWSLFGPLRAAAHDASPNAAHLALARVESRVPGAMTIITQNIDGLHSRAGSSTVIEIHGRASITRCSRNECSLQPFDDDSFTEGVVPACELCHAPLRPDIVFFNEAIPAEREWAVKKALREVDLFVAIGTSGTVSPASNYVRSAAYVGARTIYANLEPMKPPNPYFHETFLGAAEELVPKLFGS
ncbi:MAG: NAD-dependent deacetylase [Polyangiales bacterium]